jgi:hypothetical protein
MKKFWHIQCAFLFVTLFLLSSAALGQELVVQEPQYTGFPGDWLSPGAIATWTYYPGFPYLSDVPLDAIYPYAVYYPRSMAGERWWDYQPNWKKTVEFARTQSSIRVFRGGAWVTP